MEVRILETAFLAELVYRYYRHVVCECTISAYILHMVNVCCIVNRLRGNLPYAHWSTCVYLVPCTWYRTWYQVLVCIPNLYTGNLYETNHYTVLVVAQTYVWICERGDTTWYQVQVQPAGTCYRPPPKNCVDPLFRYI